MKQKPSQERIIHKSNHNNHDLASQLKARLFDKGTHYSTIGFSYGTLPSVKRGMHNTIDTVNPKSSALIVTLGHNESTQKIYKEQSTVFKAGQESKPKFERVSREPEQPKDRERMSSLAMSRVPSADKLRPGSRTKSRVTITHSQSTNRLQTPQTNIRRDSSSYLLPSNHNNDHPIQRAQTAKINEGELKRTRVLMEKMSGKDLLDRKTNKDDMPRLSQKFSITEKDIEERGETRGESKLEEKEEYNEEVTRNRPPLRAIKQLDRYIELIVKNVAYIDEFVYLKKSKNYEMDPYDLEVIDYTILKKEEKEGLKDYYTISKKGICLYHDNTPREFIVLHNWLEERRSFDEIKSLNFFRKFRKWKTLRMWHRIIMREKMAICGELLREKLFLLNYPLRQALLGVRKATHRLETLRILRSSSSQDYNQDAIYSLAEFVAVQDKNREVVKDSIKNCSKACRELVEAGFKKSIARLRSEHKPMPKTHQQDDMYRRKLPKSFGPSSKEAAYEKLQFPDDMNFQMRSSLRSECLKFLRFAYLVDFVALDSLKKIYLSSLDEFKDYLCAKSREQNVFIQKESYKELKSTIEPIFTVILQAQFSEIRAEKIVTVEPFLLPPSGTSTIADFKILAHVNLRVPRKRRHTDSPKKSNKSIEEESEYEDATIFQMGIPPPLCQHWLSISPTSEEHFIEINNCLYEGLETLECFERWSRHPDMKLYLDILEEWDDKIADYKNSVDSYLHPNEWIDTTCNELAKEEIRNTLDKSFDRIMTYIQTLYEPFLQMQWENKQIDYDLFTHEQLSEPTESIQYTLEHLVYQKDIISRELPYVLDKEILRVDSVQLKKYLEPRSAEILGKIYQLLPPFIKRKNDELETFLEQSIRALKVSTTNVADFVNQMKSLRTIEKKVAKSKEKISLIGQLIQLLESMKQSLGNNDKDALKVWKGYQTHLLQEMGNLETAITKAEEGAEKNIIRFSEQVNKTLIPNLNKEINKLQSAIEEKKYLSLDTDMHKAIAELEAQDEQVIKYEFDAKQYSQYELTLNMSETRFDNLDDLRVSLNHRLDMWRGLRDWQRLSESWLGTVFEEIDVEQIKSSCEKYTRIVSKSSKKLPPNPVLETLRRLLAQFKDAMPVVIALSSRAVQEDPYYWSEIQRIVGAKFIISPEFRLGDLISMGLYVYQNEIIDIATLAKQEQLLKAQIEENRSRWIKLEFTTKEYKGDDPRSKDAFVLDKVDELYAELDEILANFSAILGNRYLRRQREQAEEIQKVVYNAMLIIDDWLIVQKNWIYLENIFSSGDIKTKLREEAAKFELIDKNFKKHMLTTSRSKFVCKNLGNHDIWLRYKEVLTEIQKELERHLEDKRNEFPRFYFLSNDELIEILAKANDTETIQKNIRKCFDSIARIVFQEDSRFIESLCSMEGEMFRLNKTNINAKGEIENWLKLLEAAIDESLRKYIAKGFVDYEQSKKRIDFIQQHLSQVTLVICQVNWTLDTEALLDNLDDYFKILLKQLSKLTEFIRDPSITSELRKTLIALITQDVHNRDIVDSLMQIDSGVNKTDFPWMQQLRFYMEGENIDATVIVRQISTEINYGYEYLGVMSRLVITPLTDRCWITIIGAINIKLGAAPAGPAGTGKTESTKDLAKGLGMLCIVFNCSEQIDYKIVGRLFSGLAQQGAWSCLDEFNRIDIEVLSVIAQQLFTIRVAKLKNDTTFFFIDRIINLRPNCGVFITMNPGYAGRTELPDNLKVLFRSVSMMIPDYKLIAEIMLFAEGFEDAKLISNKMVQLYKLSSEQLSHQDHYDFGMRAVKSVLVMAGTLKRASKDTNEDEVLIRAMRDANIPKFLKDDLPLFEALISDLFPHCDIKETDYLELEQEICKTTLELQLQVIPEQTKKTIQLYETFNVRFGVMIVGHTDSGKTACINILGKSLTALAEQSHLYPNKNYKHVKTHTLNPKALSMGELYGQVNELTQEWSDGLASSILRQCTNEEQPNTMNWVIFDGPVDALWIENMNTVLDDNMMLCLANGERIKLIKSMRMLFEVMDLKVASPATVSRCGMVYMLTEDLTWRTPIKTWANCWLNKMVELDDNDEYWLTDMRTYLQLLFEKTIDPMHTFITRRTKEPIPTSPIQLARNLTHLLEIFCHPNTGYRRGQDREYKRKFLSYTFVYALIWSSCVTAFDRHHEELSLHCRTLLEQMIYPNNDYLQNYYFEPLELCFKPWTEKLSEYIYIKEQPYQTIVVETIDTIRYFYIVECLTQKLKPVLLTGQSGTGKSILLNKITSAPLMLTSTTSHHQIQLSVESKLEKIRKNMLGAAPGNVCIVAIDDTSMPVEEEFGAIPAIEVLRCMIDKQGIWDRKEHFWKHIESTAFVCACSPPGSGRNFLTPRFTKHFNVLCLPEASHANLTRIFKSILDGFFTTYDFPDTVGKSSEQLVNATIEIYTLIKKEKLPIPAKFHYGFNLRDVSKVFQGMLECRRNTVRDVDSVAKLWHHECSRVLKDRLNTEVDHLWMEERMAELTETYFRVRIRECNIYFTNMLKLETREYELIPDLKKIVSVLEEAQEEHNSVSKDSKLEIVFFKEAIEHVLRVQRILSLSRGNGLLLGVSGSGKQSLTRLASSINNYKVKQIEINKGYNLESFHTFLKSLMRECSDTSSSITFLFTDNQIVSELFLEDINNLLNSGEIPNLWQLEEKEEIINATRPFNALLKRPESPEIIYRTFVERVRDRLHMILSMSPIGSALRVRCRKFPALVNCCTINWFFPWPKEALLNVSYATLNKYDKLPSYTNLPKRHDILDAFSDICKEVHISANEEACRFEATLRRKVYTAPKSYLDMLKLFLKLLERKQNEVQEKIDRLEGGLDKLKMAAVQVTELEAMLTKLKPELELQNVMLEKALIEVERDSRRALEIELTVSVEAEDVARQKNEIQLLTDEAREKLKEVEPELERAKRAVETIDRKALETIRNYPKPPAIVETIMEGVCILFGIKGDWEVQKKLLIKLDDFIISLKEYKKDSIPEDRLVRLRSQLQKSEFREEVIVKKVREMLEIAQWCKAIEKYAVVAKEIEPKKRKMHEMQGKLDEANRELEVKMGVLLAAQEKVRKLETDTREMTNRKRELERDLQLTKDRLERASELTVLTRDEAIRWKETVEIIKSSVINIPVDVFIASAAISYNGPFTAPFRKNLVDYWISIVTAKDLPLSSEYEIAKVLGDPLTIRDWMIDGLPSDTISLENAIFCSEGIKWPLMIDPQEQAYNWLNKILSREKKTSTKLTNTNFLSEMKASVKNGLPVLLLDIEDTLPASLDPIFSKQLTSINNILHIKLGEENINYDTRFKLYLFTKHANPNFLPEIFIRVNVINFTVTLDGLKEQLLAMVVEHEREEVEKQRDENVVKLAIFNKKINESELEILKLLKRAKAETILDNIELIEILKQSQTAASEIKLQIVESKHIEKNISLVRQQYIGVSTRGAVLFFVIKDLALVDSMYQYSLQYIEKIFHTSMSTAEHSEDIGTRLTILEEALMRDVYKNVTRGLFGKHKTFFSFIIAVAIQREAKTISEDMWNVFSKGALTIGKNISKDPPENPSKTLFSPKTWELADYLENTFSKFAGITNSFINKTKQWEAEADSGKLSDPLPDDWDHKLELFDRIVLTRVLQPQKIVSAMSYYVHNTIGSFYLEAPSVSVKDLWKDSDCSTPIIFVLSSGADPTSSLLKFANEMTIDLEIISLGQGQGKPAETAIKRGKTTGKWVLLQNCHLARTWMPNLERLVEDNLTSSADTHTQFRLFLTSMPASYFPTSVLQNGIKLTTEPPRGLKANLRKSWNEIDEEQLNSCPDKVETLHKLLWGLTFFHAIVQERQKFGPLGWNIKYEFNESDLETSKTVLTMLLGRADIVPFEALLFVTGEINYGGRVTDDWDRRCLLTILRKFYIKTALDRKYQFSKATEYYLPEYQSLENYKSYIDALPFDDSTLIFGMHHNAKLSYLQQEEKEIMDTLAMIQPKEALGTGKSSQSVVLDLVTGLLDRKEIPDLLDPRTGHKELFVVNDNGLLPSLTTFLLQEVSRFNELLRTIKSTLEDLKKAINGLILFSDELELMFSAVLVNKVPTNWGKVAYPSLKPLSSWLKDLRQRVSFLKEWLHEGTITNYWFSAFFFPQGFLTGVLQEFARQPGKEVPIDELVFSFKFTDLTREKCIVKATEGIYVSGLYLEGAAWDVGKRMLAESIKNEIHTLIPIVTFLPLRNEEKKANDKLDTYECPVYKTSLRAGVLSTTGQSTNFVLAVETPCLEPSEYWILQGTAFLLQLND